MSRNLEQIIKEHLTCFVLVAKDNNNKYFNCMRKYNIIAYLMKMVLCLKVIRI